MPTIEKKAVIEKGYGHAIISNKVKNYADDPFFVKKTEEARQALKRVGLPVQKKS
jgi:hypothetical protein